MWNKIIHPKTGRKVNLNSKIGKQVLRNYVNQIGGAEQAGVEDEYADIKAYINEFGNINQALVQSIADDDINSVIQILEYSRHNKVLKQQLLEIEQILTTDIVKKGRIVSEKKLSWFPWSIVSEFIEYPYIDTEYIFNFRGQWTKRSILSFTIEQGNPQILERLLEYDDNTTVNSTVPNGRTLLIQAVLLNNLYMVDVLIQHGANMDVLDKIPYPYDSTDNTALIMAVRGRHGRNVGCWDRQAQYYIVKLLVESGADQRIKNSSGKTAKDYAIEAGDPGINCLLEVLR